MPPEATALSAAELGQELANDFIGHLSLVHDDDEIELKRLLRNTLAEVHEHCLGRSLADANTIRENFINDCLANLGGIG